MTRVSIMKYVVLAFGGLLLAVAIVTAQNTRSFVAHAATAHGAVIDMVKSQSSDSNAYAPVVRFVTAEGETIEFKSNVSSDPPSYVRGESVGVLYRPLAPRDARVDGFASLWAGPILFAAIGSVFFVVGASWLLAAILTARKAAGLMRDGKRILTTVQRVVPNEHLRVNGRNPYRVFTQWKNPSTSESQVFESDYVWFDPSPYLRGRSISVFVERGNPRRYFVDLSFLPKSAG